LTNVAILIGNSQYETLSALTCCEADVHAIKELIDATGKFESIQIILNSAASPLKDRIREAFNNHKPLGEVFFYFTGHGFLHETEFFFCATNFDAKRPNETGLSNSELHNLLRSLEARLVVKVIDACNSGTLLVKSTHSLLSTNKHGLSNLIQIASCLDSQNALTGNPLSVFTEKFRAAALRKTDGVIYYTDIIDTLRDEFLDSDSQTPHFVSQGTGREQFVETAKKFDGLRAKLVPVVVETGNGPGAPSGAQPSLSSLEILERAEGRFAKKELAQEFISRLFDKLANEASADGRFGQLFSSELVVHSDFKEPTARDFIIRVLAGEKRPDNFVVAEASEKRNDPFGLGAARIAAALAFSPAEAAKHYVLRLNCTLDKVQLKITFSPRFVTLKQFVLVVSCAPSLEHCYVMEILTEHSLVDWGAFDSEGLEVVRRWYKMNWTDSCDGLVSQIGGKLRESVDKSIAGALKTLSA
jgi:hypothetical protein